MKFPVDQVKMNTLYWLYEFDFFPDLKDNHFVHQQKATLWVHSPLRHRRQKNIGFMTDENLWSIKKKSLTKFEFVFIHWQKQWKLISLSLISSHYQNLIITRIVLRRTLSNLLPWLLYDLLQNSKTYHNVSHLHHR